LTAEPERTGESRVVGIDFGERRIGIALSDPTRTIATPLETIQRRKGKRMPLTSIEAVARTHHASHLVVGLPLDLRGEETEWCAEVRAAGDRLAERLGVAVDYVDERFTSVRAERTIRDLGLSRTKRREKERVDAGAAALILQGWLDSHSDMPR